MSLPVFEKWLDSNDQVKEVADTFWEVCIKNELTNGETKELLQGLLTELNYRTHYSKLVKKSPLQPLE